MAVVDTIAALAMSTTEREPKGTASQNTQFIRPAFAEDLRDTVTALNFSKTIAYAEAKFTFADSGKLVAQVTLAFVF